MEQSSIKIVTLWNIIIVNTILRTRDTHAALRQKNKSGMTRRTFANLEAVYSIDTNIPCKMANFNNA